jgi:iron-sulfur cluster repair protein YtfE (RIC family)
MLSWLGFAVSVTMAVNAAAPAPATPQALKPPSSIQHEHEEIHEALVALTKVTGPVGTAAAELAKTLHPHFVREEEIALPPLGLLAPLAEGKTPAGMAEAAKMADTLKKEMPRMMEEHKAIRAAVGKLRTVAQQEKHAAAEEFAATLAQHALTEEEVLYPAAILVGDVIRARTAR